MSLDQAEMTVKQDLECAIAALDMQQDDFLQFARSIRQKAIDDGDISTETEVKLG
jgi:hypothetical protein